MFKIMPKCSICQREIKGNDVVFVNMRYPERKGMTEIKAYTGLFNRPDIQYTVLHTGGVQDQKNYKSSMTSESNY